jgi:hypothetical protein
VGGDRCCSSRRCSSRERAQREVCGVSWMRPLGVRHCSPGKAWQRGQSRVGQQREMCGSGRVSGRLRCLVRGSMQRFPGRALQLGHDTSSGFVVITLSSGGRWRPAKTSLSTRAGGRIATSGPGGRGGGGGQGDGSDSCGYHYKGPGRRRRAEAAATGVAARGELPRPWPREQGPPTPEGGASHQPRRGRRCGGVNERAVNVDAVRPAGAETRAPSRPPAERAALLDQAGAMMRRIPWRPSRSPRRPDRTCGSRADRRGAGGGLAR